MDEIDFVATLQEIREEYWRGLTEIAEEPGEKLECITFILGGELYAIESVHAAEVIRCPKLVLVPGVNGAIAGIFNLRGEITGAVDIRLLLGYSRRPAADAQRVLVVKGESFRTGILCEAVTGVEQFRVDLLDTDATESNTGEKSRYVRGVVTTEQGPVQLLDAVRLMSSSLIRV